MKKFVIDVNVFSIGCEFQNGCPSGPCRADEDANGCEEETGTNANDDPQILRHLVLLILLLCSMFIVRKSFFLLGHYSDRKINFDICITGPINICGNINNGTTNWHLCRACLLRCDFELWTIINSVCYFWIRS